MEDKRRSKRSKVVDEGYWDCSVCTYQNSPEAFKCDMCDVRKGTSTRKPRLNAQLVAQQVAQQFAPPAKKERPLQRREKHNTSASDVPTAHSNKKNRSPRLKNIDRSSGISMEVTVGNVTVVITDYKPKTDRNSSSLSCESTSPSANSRSICDSTNNESSDEKPDSKHTDSDISGDLDTVPGNS
ncbi:YY1-associated factor 2 [Lamellibrachia satsuma]|nr:YY1-associated factor 2 [Lamellibrachia satsuma]